MCGIAGILSEPGKQVEITALESMGKVLRHRGPDNFGLVIDGHVGMSHNRLSILDLSELANQPYRNDDYILSYNGEIYNYLELKKVLEVEFGIKFRTTSDTEVLFHLLINHGIEKCLNEIRGMFAFAFYDKRADVLMLARDRLGIKPLYYTKRANSFYWASEMKALAKHLGLSPDPTKTLFAIGGSGERSRRNTLFDDVYAVEPGSYLKITPGGAIDRRSYYNAIDQFDVNYYEELDRLSRAEIVSEFERLFTASVEGMMMSDAPMGGFVSGGVDSALIVAVAKQTHPDVQLFTANVVGRLSEYEDARSVAKHINAKLSESRFEPQNFITDWVETTYFYESPIVVHTNAVPLASVAKVARESEVKAVLTGEGADELFLGYPRLLTQRYNRLALFPDTVLKSLYKLVPGLYDYLFPNPKNNLMGFVGNLAQNFEAERLTHNNGTFSSLDKRGRVEQQMTIQMLNDHLVTLLHRNDRMGMMRSIEARFPFLDEDVVKFAINLPSRFKIAVAARFHDYKHPFLVDKWAVRKLAEKYLPKKIAYKTKFGFGMFGHKYIRLDKDFFRNGWLTNNLKLDSAALDHLVDAQDPYFVAKLASVEIFGRIFSLNEDLEKISTHVQTHANLRTV
jgi:asparagine synthase (glutamine-hydrolysing)